MLTDDTEANEAKPDVPSSGDPTRSTHAEAAGVRAAFPIPAADLNTRAMGRKPRPSARRKPPKEPTHGTT